MNKTVAFVIYHVDFIENLGLPYLSAVAKKAGWKTDLIVFDKNTVDSDMKRINPDIIAYSTMSADAAIYKKINEYLKSRYDFVSIMGGPHPTYFPDVRFEEGLDFICRGEGEAAFAEFLEKFEKNEDLETIQNIGNKNVLNPLRKLEADLDNLPLPDRDLTFGKTELAGSHLKIFMSSRGCPFTCTYCFNNPLNEMQAGLGKRHRTFSPERIVEEIDAVRAKYPLSFIKFQDDLFAPKTSWLADFSKVYASKVGLPFNALERLDLVTEERLKLLKEAGCQSLTFAIDSANPDIRTHILERGMRIPNEEIIERLKLVRSHGIHTMTNFILGVPTSTVQDELDAVDINVRGRVSLGITSTLVPYPGTAIYNYCVKHKLLDSDISMAETKRPLVQMIEDNQFSSIQKKSILNCFTEKEKSVLLNVSTVFSVMCAIPWLKPVLFKLCKTMTPNRMFVYLAIMVKGYKTDRYIYPTRMPFSRKLRFLLKALRIEGGRMMGKKADLMASEQKARFQEAA